MQLYLAGDLIVAQEAEDEFEDQLDEDVHEEEEAANPIIPEWNEIIWGSLAFLILFIIMWKYAYPAIRKAMEDRTAKIQGDIDAAETARAEAEQLRAEYDSRIADAQQEANRILEQARQDAESVRQERIAAIDTEIAERRAQADADIEAAKARAQTEVRAQVSALAIGAAEAIVERSLDDETNRQLVENFIDRVGN